MQHILWLCGQGSDSFPCIHGTAATDANDDLRADLASDFGASSHFIESGLALDAEDVHAYSGGAQSLQNGAGSRCITTRDDQRLITEAAGDLR
jgi:hypothetical protein